MAMLLFDKHYLLIGFTSYLKHIILFTIRIDYWKTILVFSVPKTSKMVSMLGNKNDLLDAEVMLPGRHGRDGF